jgi:predicted nuclease with RNAse H fold
MEKKIAGLDLAALPKNESGVCILKEGPEFFILYEDEEILSFFKNFEPDIVAIDAPLMEEVRIRKADLLLKKYGAMPPTMQGMEILTRRARELVKRINCRVIEVFPTATAKILGIYDKNWRNMAEKLRINVKSKHELDAYLAAYTAYLYLIGKAEEVGDEEKVVIPKKIKKFKFNFPYILHA